MGYFTYNHDSLDFSCEYHALVAFPYAVNMPSLPILLDVFYDFLIWTSIEPCLGVVGCCLPTLGPLVDLKNSAFYIKLKGTFSRPSLLQRSVSRASRDESDPSRDGSDRRAWVELTNETYSQPKPIERHGVIANGKYLDDVLPAAHQHRLASVEHSV